MLTELRLTNFKAFGETQRIPIKPLTLIFGANSSGKSSIIHSLLLANEARSSGSFDVCFPRLAARRTDLGGFSQYVHNQDANQTVVQQFEINLDANRFCKSLPVMVDEEKSVFSSLTRVAFGFYWGARGVPHRLDVNLDGHPVLSFSLTESGMFKGEVLRGFATAFHGEINRQLERIEWNRWNSENRPPSELALELNGVTHDLEPHWGKPFQVDGPQLEPSLIEAEWLKTRAREREEHRKTFVATEEQVEQFLAEVSTDIEEARFAVTQLIFRNWFPWMFDQPDLQHQFVSGTSESGVYANFHSAYEDEGILKACAMALRFLSCALVQECSRALAELLGQLRYLGPLRRVPDRHLMDVPVLEREAADLRAWFEVLHEDALRDQLNGWLGKKFGLPYTMVPNPLRDGDNRQVGIAPQFLVSNSPLRLSHLDLGFGISQLLPILVEATASKGSLVAIEQPEAQLHPAHQAELGDVFIESALGERKNTFLLETHSEHLILRILRRIRETTEGKATRLPPVRAEDVAVLFVQPGPKGVEVIELPVTPDGDFDRPWPGGFFAERFEDLP